MSDNCPKCGAWMNICTCNVQEREHYKKLAARCVELEKLNLEWEKVFRSDDLPDIVTPGHAVECVRAFQAKISKLRILVTVKDEEIERLNGLIDPCSQTGDPDADI